MLQELNSTTATIANEPTLDAQLENLPVSVQCSRFQGANGVEELQWMIRPTRYAPFDTQLEWVRLAYEHAVKAAGLTMNSAVWRRFLCSDLLNQKDTLKRQPLSSPEISSDPCAISWVGQPPAAPSKVTLWAHHIHDPAETLDKSTHDNTLCLHRGDLTHHWTTGINTPGADGAYLQTLGIFDQYDQILKDHNLTLADNVVRTWFFAKDIDSHYDGLVEARNAVFDQCGLTSNTHYIASTGIEGGSSHVSSHTMMDAYAIGGLRPEQISYLRALNHLSPTHIYGVAFERGTSIAYRDRRHLFISGTASIDSMGDIVHPGDVFKQLNRTLTNIEALLAEAGAAISDMQVMLVYLRDPNDCAPILKNLQERFPLIPFEVVTAPVCRPGWLIEIEGLAVIKNDSRNLPEF